MIAELLKDNKFYSIQPTVFLKNVDLKKWAHDAHIRVDFENENFQRCDIHGTLRMEKDAKGLWKKPDRKAVSRALWVYSNGTFRSPKALSWWIDNAGVTYSDLKTICRELADQLKTWAFEIEKDGCEILEAAGIDQAQPISLIGVSKT
jgi:hypothetical protein